MKTILLTMTCALALSGCLNTVNAPNNAQIIDTKQQNIKTTPSGLQYQIHRAGSGETAKFGDKLKVRYTGKLLNGKVFDSGVFDLTLQDGVVIEGWTEGLQLMKKGGQYTLFVPANLAYGEMSPTPDIPDNSPLIFEMEVLELIK